MKKKSAFTLLEFVVSLVIAAMISTMMAKLYSQVLLFGIEQKKRLLTLQNLSRLDNDLDQVLNNALANSWQQHPQKPQAYIFYPLVRKIVKASTQQPTTENSVTGYVINDKIIDSSQRLSMQIFIDSQSILQTHVSMLDQYQALLALQSESDYFLIKDSTSLSLTDGPQVIECAPPDLKLYYNIEDTNTYEQAAFLLLSQNLQSCSLKFDESELSLLIEAKMALSQEQSLLLAKTIRGRA